MAIFNLTVLSPSQIALTLSNLLPRLHPSLHHRIPFLSSELVQCGPIYIVLVHKIDVAAVCLEELGRGHELPEVLVVLDFLAGGGVNERIDEFEEGPDDPRD